MSAGHDPGILVLGIGNVLLGDDGAGVHAVRALAAHGAETPALRFLDGGTLSFSLAAAIEDCARLIVLDAAEMDAPAGEVRVFEGEAMDAFLGGHRRRSVHEVGLLDLMAVAALSKRLPRQRALIAIQPAAIGWSEQPTEKVAASLEQACAAARGLAERWCA